MSDPAPPAAASKPAGAPPTKRRLSSPAPRSTVPEIAAPAFTITEKSPTEPVIALRFSLPTKAPLWSTIVAELPLCALALIAALPASEPPVTEPDTVMRIIPVPLCDA